MNKICDKVKTTICKVGFAMKKHSPEILVVAGVIGTVASAVIACKATTKVSTILGETKEIIDSIHNCSETMPEEYSEEDAKKDLTIVYAQTAVKFIKLYAPSVLLGTLSIASILTSNNILKKRNVALASAYAVVDRSFKEYRNNVVERFGKEIDKELRYGIKAITLEEKVVDPESGEETTKTVEKVVATSLPSDFSKFFDESSPCWEKDSDYNLMFLKSEQSYANDRLRANGYLFLNEVYERLGLKKTKAGQIVGWIYDPEHNKENDNYVDFGIYDIDCKRKRQFVNGYERSILLDFNVDGPILNKIEDIERE